jgi:UDP-2,3-diacylglucosamine pyrophosphatase LpxH
MRTGLTVSDFHLLSHHSRSRDFLEELETLAGSIDVLVLNGDIFDFKWSQHAGVLPSVAVAERQIEHLLRVLPNCEVHYVLGNHDAVTPFQAALERLAKRHHSFHWHEFVCRMEAGLFLHGDVVHAGSSNAAVRAFREQMGRPRSDYRWQRMAHGALHRSTLPRLAFTMVPKRLLAARIVRYLSNENWLPDDSVRHVYFGHTHSGFENFTYRGLRFHNSGSATLGAHLRPIRFRLG